VGGPGITNPTEEHFERGSWQWDGLEWVKALPQLAYSDRWAEQKSNLSAAPGTNYLDSDVVPAGEVWELHFCGGVDVNNACSIQLNVNNGSFNCAFVDTTAKAAGAWLIQFPIGLTLKEGDFVRVYFFGCTLNDDIYARFWGKKMSIP